MGLRPSLDTYVFFLLSIFLFLFDSCEGQKKPSRIIMSRCMTTRHSLVALRSLLPNRRGILLASTPYKTNKCSFSLASTQRLFSTSPETYKGKITEETRMAAASNNEKFKLENLFNVKGKGMHTFIFTFIFTDVSMLYSFS